MPKSKRNRVVNLTQVNKKTREQKDKLFANIRESVPEYQHCFVFGVNNMRNNYLKEVRHELNDCRLFFGKTKLMAKALGQDPSSAVADGIDRLTPFLAGTVGLLFTNRDPAAILSYFDGVSPVDFARAGTVATRGFSIPSGVVYATGGEVPAEHDVPLEHSIEPELRRLGMPTRMIKGRVCLGDAEGGGDDYVVCREGDVLDSRQTRLLKLFGICLSEFKVKVLGYWSASTGKVTEVNPNAMDGVEDESD
ncbi:Ribosomal protein L10 [Colletotrichum higginsianum IMI 349063]|uniref:Ribosome assembly factor mrt4 n=4 Tax=Colletotrichum destructivum species complex TaxID=2707350 RepID=A0A1B7YNP4_COLHI|nr:Ribosomal protein L10 [Colletotrichum higginsianum IMI 349063]OBR13677.1 Ribosomal protein L10 [Colletotrichum higginsianum IMI 349063]TID02541.1 Ribosome assembly factor mrt4 [Colletotrichum higginsianum]WQF75621.1 Putative large ribosomal subunit protein uL10 [Colletotrichum destructivum]GJC95657.1 ribosomal protein L10 [Colletotrichum higginsianum]